MNLTARSLKSPIGVARRGRGGTDRAAGAGAARPAGLQEIQSFAGAGDEFINLEFAIGTDMGRMLIDVIARMNQLPPLPRDAVIVRADGAHVFRIGNGNFAGRIAAQLGNGNSERVEVRGELAAGDRVVARGGERLRAGQAVMITASSAAATAKAAPPAG